MPSFLRIVFIIVATVASVSSVSAYTGFEADYATCTTGQSKVANAKVVQACSRLIKNAAKENELVGFFYALRASANREKISNCKDARKARSLIKDLKLAASINALEKANCPVTAAGGKIGCLNDQSSEETARGRLSIKSVRGGAGRAEKVYVLTLSKPICLKTDDKADFVASTTTVHIFGAADIVHAAIAGFVDRTVRVRGRPFPAHTVYHHAPIVMEITKIDPI